MFVGHARNNRVGITMENVVMLLPYIRVCVYMCVCIHNCVQWAWLIDVFFFFFGISKFYFMAF